MENHLFIEGKELNISGKENRKENYIGLCYNLEVKKNDVFCIEKFGGYVTNFASTHLLGNCRQPSKRNIPPITYSALADFRSKGECGDGKKKLSGEGRRGSKGGEPKTKRAILTLPKVRAAQAVVAQRAINFGKV